MVWAADAYDDDSQEQRPIEDTRGPDTEEDEGLTAGELRPPESMNDHQHPSSEIEQDLEEADQKDSGRGLEFVWLEGDFGYGIFGLTTFASRDLLSSAARATAHGPLLGAAAGVRLLYFTLGGRFRYGFLSEYELVTAGAELGMRVPLGSIEPFAALGVGYAATNRINPLGAAPEHFAVKGLDLRVTTGLDYYLSDTFSVGGKLSGDVLFLGRRAQSPSPECSSTSACPYLEKGKSVGGGFSLVLSLGLHI